MCIVGDDNMDREYMIEMGEKFYMGLHGKLGKKTNLLDHLCEVMYAIPINIPVSLSLSLFLSQNTHLL